MNPSKIFGKIIFIGGLSLLLLLSGCVSQTPPAKDDSTPAGPADNGGGIAPEDIPVEKGDIVRVHYRGMLTDGTVFDASVDNDNNPVRQPLEFTAGSGQMIKGFDEAVLGMKALEEKTVTLPPEKAYSQWSEENVSPVPIEQFADLNATLEKGTKLYASGREVVVYDLNEDTVWIDFNHDLAGKTLIFWIKVMEIGKVEANMGGLT